MNLNELVRALTAQARGLEEAELRIAKLIEAVNRQAAKLKQFEEKLASFKNLPEERHEEPEQSPFDESADEGAY